ncbi:ribose 5-phosphate isomerase B [candidate division KSB1 bacterium]|nr:ribose 5-phosphate isomerase B [candidate division KSB1 bacterium]NIR72834.1 ribose 5-phosphate isomerase B [candidate division KSB1 bacterium]NIS26874.1 ribose 5-phosphate isomerase B [candidate division KSB1 bacterium]NIT73670.1 ribose 5-phosphate isomerase B [candidate division KSB1 bacterium]NIU27541.1 ribose 5-phosphate isomerase B [candidate division KSB1 bacterium]
MKKLLTERDVIDAWRSRRFQIPIGPHTVVTPAAADLAKAHYIEIIKASPSSTIVSSASASKRDVDSKIVIGSDHGGFDLKEELKQYLMELGLDVEDVGTHSTDSVDYPDFAHAVARKVAQGHGSRGVIIDGAGVGSAITANKVPGVRAATCHDVYTAKNSREHNHANVLTMGSRVLGLDVAKQILKAWLETSFGSGRHEKRVGKIVEIERQYAK